MTFPKQMLTCVMLGLVYFIMGDHILSNFTDLLNYDQFNDLDEKGVIISGKGEIKSGQYYYTTITDLSPIEIYLESKPGDDVDLYVSSKGSPTFDLNNHDFSSYTCGTENMFISENYKRPLYVGVYCYNSYLNCSFYLSISTVAEEDIVIAHTSINHDEKKFWSNKPKVKSSIKLFFQALFEWLKNFIRK